MTFLKGLLAGALLLLVTTSTALTAIYITEDGGGVITEFEQRYATFKAARETVVLDGVCASACTLVFTMPKHRVCYTDRVKMGFHNAAVRRSQMTPPVFSQEGTDMMWKAYPKELQDLLIERGWDGHELEGWQEGRLVWLDANDMATLGYTKCGDEPWWVKLRQWWVSL